MILRSWWEDDPGRLAQEIDDIGSVAPALEWTPEGAGHFSGALPVWPFTRPEPAGLSNLVDQPLRARVAYGHGFPAVPPIRYPWEPQPDVTLRSFTQYHVLPNGGLCLLRDADQWDLFSRTSDLILKASGWMIEFALFQRGKIPNMTVNGIVTDEQLDHLITATAEETA